MSRTRRAWNNEWPLNEWRRSTDGKGWLNPPGYWKKMRRRMRRSASNQAVRIGVEPERERRTDAYDWS